MFPTPEGIFDSEFLHAPHGFRDHCSWNDVPEVDSSCLSRGETRIKKGVRLVCDEEMLHDLVDHTIDRGIEGAVDCDFRFTDRNPGGGVFRENISHSDPVGSFDADAYIRTTRPQGHRIDHVGPVRGSNDDDIVEGLNPVHFHEELKGDHGFHVEGDAGSAGSEKRLHFVEKHDNGHIPGGQGARPRKSRADLPLRLSDEFVEKLLSFDRQEVGAFPAARPQWEIRDGFHDQSLARIQRAVREDASGGLKTVGAVHPGVGEG